MRWSNHESREERHAERRPATRAAAGADLVTRWRVVARPRRSTDGDPLDKGYLDTFVVSKSDNRIGSDTTVTCAAHTSSHKRTVLCQNQCRWLSMDLEGSLLPADCPIYQQASQISIWIDDRSESNLRTCLTASTPQRSPANVPQRTRGTQHHSIHPALSSTGLGV